ncbi:MAG: FkbM family methyltransferase [Nocardiaceae bacterium]|nr:FkbM family methyltransferase [Nocardiaceae bacterium]
MRDLASLVPPRARSLARRAVNKAGLEVSRFPFFPRLASILEQNDISTVVDVGANIGQYGRYLRSAGYGGRIISVEPLSDAFAQLSRAAQSDPTWDVLHAAVSSDEGEVTINRSANSVSSSILAPLDAHLDAASESRIVGRETVRSVTVDGLLRDFGVNARQTMLKIDVQGFEADVLDGAEATLSSVGGLQIELSVIPLYDGSTTLLDMLCRLTESGLDLWMLEPGFSDAKSLRMLQCDGVFLRGK